MSRVAPDSVPRLAPHVRMRFDAVRDRWVVMAPERMLVPDDIAADVLRRLDGGLTVAALTGLLAADYQATQEEIAGDVTEMLQDLVDKGFVDV